jgi:RNA polymerase sigma-70 factor (ECF subfamily)
MDEAEIADAYRSHAPAIFAHCRRLLASPALARDATQEVFVRVLAGARSLPKGDEGLRYLYRVATNHCLNQLRDGRVRQRAATDLLVRTGDGSAEPAYAERQFVEKLLQRSPLRDIEIAVLHWIDGMAQVEIAATLKMSRRAVYARLKKVEALAMEIGQPVPADRAPPTLAEARAVRGGGPR